MTNLQDARVTDCLPACISAQPWARAISYALGERHKKFMQYAKNMRMYAAVNDMPGSILDLMAFDLRVPNYNDDYTIDVKRILVKTALNRWESTGTKAVVEEICNDIFGDATVIEWYEYGGETYYFKVQTVNAKITGENVEQFKAAINSVKRLSAWLETVELVLGVPDHVQHFGFALYDVSETTITMIKED